MPSPHLREANCFHQQFQYRGEVWAYEPNEFEVYDVGMWFNLGVKDWLWGHAKPGLEVTISTPRDTVNSYADPACNGCWGINDPIKLNPGDIITVSAGEAIYPVEFTIPTPLEVNADSTTEQVSGQIGGWDTRTVAIHGWWENGDQEVTSDASGNFSATFSNIPRGGKDISISRPLRMGPISIFISISEPQI